MYIVSRMSYCIVLKADSNITHKVSFQFWHCFQFPKVLGSGNAQWSAWFHSNWNTAFLPNDPNRAAPLVPTSHYSKGSGGIQCQIRRSLFLFHMVLANKAMQSFCLISEPDYTCYSRFVLYSTYNELKYVYRVQVCKVRRGRACVWSIVALFIVPDNPWFQ